MKKGWEREGERQTERKQEKIIDENELSRAIPYAKHYNPNMIFNEKN